MIEPFDLSLDELLRGEDATEPLDIDRIFATPFSRVMEENKPHAEGGLDWDESSVMTHSEEVPGVRFVDVEAGVIMIDPEGKEIGCYVWTALAVDEAWQGRGLGRELVLERLLRDGENPVWALDAPAYSPGGLAAHQSAWRHAREAPGALTSRAIRIAGRTSRGSRRAS